MENSEHWLSPYAHQIETRASFLQPNAEYMTTHMIISPTAEVNQTVTQHPQLTAHLTANLQPVIPQTATTIEAVQQSQFNPEHFNLANSFSASSSLFQRPSVVQHTPHQLDVFSAPLFPFQNYFGLPGYGEMDSRFHHQTVEEGVDQKEVASNLVTRGFGLACNLQSIGCSRQEEFLLNHFNSFAAYNQMGSLEAILKKEPRQDIVVLNSEMPKNPYIASGPTLNETPLPRLIHECQVCQATQANGLHFGARTCAACAAFFRRTISDDKKYVCKRSQRCNNPQKDSTGYRKTCRACRLKRCMDIGMLPENVQHKRSRIDSPSRGENNRSVEARVTVTQSNRSNFAAVLSTINEDNLANYNTQAPNNELNHSLGHVYNFYSQIYNQNRSITNEQCANPAL